MLTKHIDKARLYACNYQKDYGDLVNNHQFHKRKQICGDTINI